MSEFHVEVIRIGAVEPLPNADSLEITKVHGGYPCIIRKGQFKEGDLAVYVPIDALVDTRKEEFAFLHKEGSSKGWQHRVRAMKLRGTFSMGLLIPSPPWCEEGRDVRENLEIQKWEPPIDHEHVSFQGGRVAKAPPGPPPPVYDLEGLRRYPNALKVGEEVVITEKIHGANGRIFWTRIQHEGEGPLEEHKVFVGSRTTWKEEDGGGLWWTSLKAEGVTEAILNMPPDYVVYGEVFGQVQDLKYGHDGKSPSSWFRAFDVYDRINGWYLDYDEAYEMLLQAGIMCVPVLYRGPWKPELVELAEGKSTFADHIREGFVVRPIRDRQEPGLGGHEFDRCVLKLVGKSYLLRKSG